MDRRAIFTPAFTAFLATQQKSNCEQQTLKRFRQPDGTYKYQGTEWTPVTEPSYQQAMLPQTLTEEDVQHSRWPIACYRFTLENGKVIESFPQDTREYLGNNVTIDFMGIREVAADGQTREMDEFSWTRDEMNDHVVGNTRGTILEPMPVPA